MPAPAEIPDVDTEVDIESMHWGTATPGNTGRAELGGSFNIPASLAMAQLDYVGYDIQHYDVVHFLDSLGVVAEGDIDKEVVTETVLDGGYSRGGTYHGWDVFDRTDMPRTVAVSESAVVASRGDDRRELIETLVDVGDGRIDRYHEADETFASFSERMGAYPSIIHGFGAGASPTDPEHGAMGYTFDDDAGYFVYHHQYLEGETPSREEIERFFEEDVETATRALSVDVQIDEPHVEVQMRVEAEEFADSSSEDRQPHVMWSVEDAGETVTIRLEAGDSISVDQLAFEPQGALVTEFDSGTVLEPGDEFTIDVEAFPEDEDTVAVVYNYAGSENSVVLLHYTPDELVSE